MKGSGASLQGLSCGSLTTSPIPSQHKKGACWDCRAASGRAQRMHQTNPAVVPLHHALLYPPAHKESGAFLAHEDHLPYILPTPHSSTKVSWLQPEL